MLPEQRHSRWRTPPRMVQKLEATCGGASFWTLTSVMGHDEA